MALQGDLQDMTVADLIQHNCLDRKTARLVVENSGQQATLFFKEGAVTDATLGDLTGEEAVYKLLTWQNGFFTLESGQQYESPTITIKQNWSSLLMEGARLLDEGYHETNGNASPNDLPDLTDLTDLSELSELFDLPDTAQPYLKKRSERLADILDELAVEGTDLEEAAVIGLDGLIHAAKMSQSLNQNNRVGTTWAAALSFSRRSVKQFERGIFKQTLIQGDRGNIVITGLDDDLIFVGLIPAEVNLGIVLSEARVVIEKLREAL